jgi:hypothetical protein
VKSVITTVTFNVPLTASKLNQVVISEYNLLMVRLAILSKQDSKSLLQKGRLMPLFFSYYPAFPSIFMYNLHRTERICYLASFFSHVVHLSLLVRIFDATV